MTGENREAIVFKVEGMSCGHCKKSIESAVRSLDGVTGADVNLEQNEVKVTFDPVVLKREALESTIKNAGYNILP